MPRNKYPEETVKKILDTSLQLFLEKGFEQTTVLDIVNNLGGLTRGAFYHHFKSKEEVFEAIFEADYAERNKFLEKVKQATVSNGLERLKLALKLGLKSNVENESRTDVTNMALSMLSNPRFLAEQIKEIQKDAVDLAAIIEEAMTDGSLKRGNANMLAELLMLLVNIWMMPTVFPCNRDQLFTKVELIEQIFTGLGFNFIDDELKSLFINVLNHLEN